MRNWDASDWLTFFYGVAMAAMGIGVGVAIATGSI